MNPFEQYFDHSEAEKSICFMKNGKRNGPGIYIWADGSRYEGIFKDDKFNGKGRVKNSMGDKFKGVFESNVLVT